jgi:hypothetical protein
MSKQIRTYAEYYNKSEFKPDEAYACKIVAVIGHGGSWAAYLGNSDWTDQEVASGGDKLREAAAVALFPTIAAQYDWRA